MPDERTPEPDERLVHNSETDEEVEAHRFVNRSDEGEDDEVEAHRLRPAPSSEDPSRPMPRPMP